MRATTGHRAIAARALRGWASCTVALLAALAAPAADTAADARFGGSGQADPIRIGQVRLAAGPAPGQSIITCDVAWDHSWRAVWEVPEHAYTLFYPDPIYNRPQDQKWEGKPPIKLENWDAAWVFAKFRAPGGEWRHATLSPLASDHVTPPEAALDVGLSDAPAGGTTLPSPAPKDSTSASSGATGTRGLGVFVYRSSPGSGANDWRDLALRWLNTVDGVTDPAAVEIRLFGIAMVYVPQGAFWAGDGAVRDPAARFYEGASQDTQTSWRTADISAQFSAGDTTYPLRIESEGALTLGGASVTNLGNRNGWGLIRGEDFGRAVTRALPANFPKGFAPFYCMRTEITEGQYVEFLNTLTFAQQRDRTLVPPDAAVGSASLCQTNSERRSPCRNSVTIAVPGNQRVEAPVARNDGAIASVSLPPVPAVYRTDGPYAACGHMTWKDLVAYCGWAGLRPMTELEFEKACRGPLKPMPNEYAWGDANVTGDKKHKARYEVGSIGKPDEHVVMVGSERAGNAAWWGTVGTPGVDMYEDAVAVTNLPSNSGEAPGIAEDGGKPSPAEEEDGGGEAPDASGSRSVGPLRAGAFARPRTGRAEAGASYWGILDLSGNLWELTITVGSASGRRFAGTHGDGAPTPSPFWRLDYDDRANPTRAFSCRGGGFGWKSDRDNLMMRVSDRAASRSVGGTFRPGQTTVGLRCVRTAP
ncbi:MAG: formylglycine-generating enzyme family protein [Lentisphaerae bacterium]|nr:formylglycine-generating enzyme family protein [Lentisphaerota bacterium]